MSKGKKDRDLSRTNTQTREQRREQAKRKWRKQPIEEFIKARENEITEKDLSNKKRVVYQFERHLLNNIAPKSDANILGVRDAVESDIESFRDNVLKPDSSGVNDMTIVHKLGNLSHFYNVLNDHNAFAGNPVSTPLKEFKQNNDIDPGRPHIPFERMQKFLSWLTLPFTRAFWLSGLKHGTRFSEVVNIDLRCLHLDHPVFWEIVKNHDVRLDPRIRDLPDTMVIYGEFNEGDEIPNKDTPGPETEGEVRNAARGNKRKEDGGSILPIDSEFKTALIEWLLVRQPTYDHTVNPLFVIGGSEKVRRPVGSGLRNRLWARDAYVDSIQRFAAEEQLYKCPMCDCNVIEENPAKGDKTGRRFRCQNCRQNHWRSIHWDTGLSSEQKMVFHVARHYFTNLHSPGKSELHDGVIPDQIRKKRIRGDADDGDTEDTTYKDRSYEQYNSDIREPYLNGIAKFGIYDEVISAVGD